MHKAFVAYAGGDISILTLMELQSSPAAVLHLDGSHRMRIL